MKVLEELYYSNEHEWVRVEGKKAYIGITDYAQHALGDIVYVEMPELGEEIEGGDVFGAIESVKAASDVFSPVSGKIVEINEELENSPELVNEKPYESWILALEMSDESELKNLMNSKAYKEFCENEDH